MSNDNLLSKILAFINTYHIFPFKQLLDYRRKLALDKTSRYSFTSEPSLMENELTA